jgi:hypothetical protein
MLAHKFVSFGAPAVWFVVVRISALAQVRVSGRPVKRSDGAFELGNSFVILRGEGCMEVRRLPCRNNLDRRYLRPHSPETPKVSQYHPGSPGLCVARTAAEPHNINPEFTLYKHKITSDGRYLAKSEALLYHSPHHLIPIIRPTN